MLLIDLFHIFSKTNYEKELKKKISSLEANIKEIEETLAAMKDESSDESTPIQTAPPILIEKIHIEKIVLDKYELNNNFGQLGIKELQGKLNIGATYGSEFVPRPEEMKKNNNRQDRKEKNINTEKGPKVNIRGKNE